MKKKQIEKLFNKWTYRLGLRWWNIKLYIYDDPKDIMNNFKSEGDAFVAATSLCDWRYTNCNIEINYPEVKKMNKADTEKIIIHELCHALVNEMEKSGIDHEERVVTGLTNAFLWTAMDCEGKLK